MLLIEWTSKTNYPPPPGYNYVWLFPIYISMTPIKMGPLQTCRDKYMFFKSKMQYFIIKKKMPLLSCN